MYATVFSITGPIIAYFSMNAPQMAEVVNAAAQNAFSKIFFDDAQCPSPWSEVEAQNCLAAEATSALLSDEDADFRLRDMSVSLDTPNASGIGKWTLRGRLSY